MVGNTRAAVAMCGTVAAVSGTICSSHLTSFLSVACALSLSRSVSRPRSLSMLLNHQITGCSHSLTPFSFFFFLFSSYALGEGVARKGRAQQPALYSAQTRQRASGAGDAAAHSHKRVRTRTLRQRSPKHWTHTGGSDKMWIISHPTSTVGQTKGTTHACIHTYICTHAYTCMHASTHKLKL